MDTALGGAEQGIDGSGLKEKGGEKTGRKVVIDDSGEEEKMFIGFR